jgi:hypothetical protein
VASVRNRADTQYFATHIGKLSQHRLDRRQHEHS